MDKDSFKLTLKQMSHDRQFMSVLIGVLLSGIIYLLILGFSIHARDIQIYTRYTAFGEAHFYKNPWQYTILFAVFGPLVALIHSAIMTRLYQLGRRQSSFIVGWFGIAILLIATICTLSIIRFAFR